jgi:hypothetical protein
MFKTVASGLWRLAAVIGDLVDVLKPAPQSMAERSTVGLRVSVSNKPAGSEGTDPMFAVALNDQQRLKIENLVPSSTDADGQAIVDPATGAPIDASALPVSWTSSDDTVAMLEFAADGHSGTIGSGKVGSAVVTAEIGPYPDGTTKRFELSVAVGNSAPGDPTFDATVESEA